MRTLAVTSQSKWADFDFTNDSPWFEFKREFEIQGFKVVRLNEKPDFIVVLNHKRWPKEFKNLNSINTKVVLVVFEPEVVAPSNHSKRIRSLYKWVYLPSPMWRMSSHERIFVWPQTDCLRLMSSKSETTREDRLVMVLGNHYSVGKSELYSLRREVALEQELPLDIFGPNWRNPTLINFLRTMNSLRRFVVARNFRIKIPKVLKLNGRTSHNFEVTENKFDTYSKYRFALVIENSPDYVSEKLLDAIVAGAIPIYVGPKLEDFGLPNTIALKVEANADAINVAVQKLLHSMELQIAIYRAGQEFLKSAQYREMVNNYALANLARLISLDFLSGESIDEQ